MTTNKKLLDLHSKLADVLLEALQEGVPVEDQKTGDIIKAPAPAAMLNVARQFLKDNNVDALPVPGSKVASIAESLPFAGSEDDEFSNTSNRH